MERRQVVIIGAGPSGSVAASFLHRAGIDCLVLDRMHFPRFVIGESLLPNCSEILAEADLLSAVESETTFQFKNGAAFSWGERYTYFDFTKKFTSGRGTTYQVRRALFDKILIDTVASRGVEVRFGDEVIGFSDAEHGAVLTIKSEHGATYQIQADFVLDASGYGRVLPHLLNLEMPSDLPPRQAHFTHIDDNICDRNFDRQKILVTTHSKYRDVWIWLIPFVDNRCSIGVVGLSERFAECADDSEKILKTFVYDCPMLARILKNASWENEVPYRKIHGYSANVSRLYGENFALLGNASEFLDPVFSSGVTIALQSAKMAAHLLIRQFAGEQVDWQKEFAEELMVGVNAFRTYVCGWYDGVFQDVIYQENRSTEISEKISAILAGYAWDKNNPLVEKSDRMLKALGEIIEKLQYR